MGRANFREKAVMTQDGEGCVLLPVLGLVKSVQALRCPDYYMGSNSTDVVNTLQESKDLGRYCRKSTIQDPKAIYNGIFRDSLSLCT